MKQAGHFNIRSITYTVDLSSIFDESYRLSVSEDLKSILAEFKGHNVFVRTVRLNILPVKSNERLDKYLFLKKIKVLAEFSKLIDVRWFNIAFDLTLLGQKEVRVITSIAFEIIKSFSYAFINFIVANKYSVNAFAAKQCARIILDISKLSHNGYDNFRVGVSLNPREGTPFFPFSYGRKDKSFSVAVEVTEGIINYLSQNEQFNLEEKRDGIFTVVSPFVKKIDRLSKSIVGNCLSYSGLDMSLAPFPRDNVSVVEILHLLGLDDIGANGTMFLTSYLTAIVKSVIRENDIKPAGFNGVMYSMLEDHLMCKSNDRKLLSIDRIIGYSTLCGCGLDMVPISGNATVEELASIILDVAAVGIRLNKPLGVRILPIPNKDENEFTEFDMDFLTNTRVMKLKNISLSSKIFTN